jgi:hypothetical protein
MPDYIDPEWEYREDNYEVLGAMGVSSRMELFSNRREESTTCLITSDPNRFNTKLAPIKEDTKTPQKARVIIKCKICNRSFIPGQEYGGSRSVCRLCPQPPNRWNTFRSSIYCKLCGCKTGKRRRMFCDSCYRIHVIQRLSLLAANQTKHPIKQCLVCKRSFRLRPHYRVKFCSHECYGQYKVGRKVTLKVQPCEYCGTIFLPTRMSASRYCSSVCSANRRWRDVRDYREPCINLEAAKSAIILGEKFGDVFRLTILEDRPSLKEWYRERNLMTLEVAIEALQSGMKFGDVLPFLSNPERDEDTLRHYFVHGCLPQDSTLELSPVQSQQLPKITNGTVVRMNGTKPYPHSPPEVKVATGDICSGCGGLMVRTGTCLTCQGCGASSGGCG